MEVRNLNWMQVEEWLRHDDRCVLPLGSVEQHAYLSLATDMVLAEKVAVDAARPLGVPVFPVLPYGLADYFSAYPGTVTLRRETYFALVTDVLDSLYSHGFRRILLVNGHGGNGPVGFVAARWAKEKGDVLLHTHHWWRSADTRAEVEAAGDHGSHANWMENFPWTRLADAVMPEEKKLPGGLKDDEREDPALVREILGDGSFGGAYQLPDDVMLKIWSVAVEETRRLLETEAWEDGPGASQ
jgi:creatinine amidohydrolase